MYKKIPAYLSWFGLTDIDTSEHDRIERNMLSDAAKHLPTLLSRAF